MKSKFSELIKHFVIYGFGSIAQSITSFILLPIITKHLNTTDYGIYTLINMTGLISGTVFYFGITSAMPRSYFDYTSEEKRNSVLSTALYIVLFGAFLQILVGILTCDYLSIYLFKKNDYSQMLNIMLFSTALGFINTFFQSYFRLLNKSVTVVILGIIASLVNFFSAISLFYFTNLTIYVPIISYTLSQFVIFVYSIGICRHQIQFSFDKKEALLMVKFGIPTIMVSFTMMAFEWSDRFFLNKYLTLAEVGIYSFAYKFGTLINPILIAPFAQIWNPLMMKYKDDLEIKALTSKIFTLYFAFGSLFCLICSSALEELIFIFVKNTDYHKATYLIPIIMISIFSYGANNISNAGFLYKRKVTEISIICFIFAGLSILFSYLLVPSFGFFGAALSTFLVYFSLSIALFLRSLKYFKFNVEAKKILWYLILNFSLIYLIYILNIEKQSLRILIKTIFIFIGTTTTLYFTFQSHFFQIIKNPKLLMQFAFKKDLK